MKLNNRGYTVDGGSLCNCRQATAAKQIHFVTRHITRARQIIPSAAVNDGINNFSTTFGLKSK